MSTNHRVVVEIGGDKRLGSSTRLVLLIKSYIATQKPENTQLIDKTFRHDAACSTKGHTKMDRTISHLLNVTSWSQGRKNDAASAGVACRSFIELQQRYTSSTNASAIAIHGHRILVPLLARYTSQGCIFWMVFRGPVVAPPGGGFTKH